MFDLLIIIVVLLLVFGAGKVRSAGSDLGAAVKDFRKALRPGAPAQPGADAPDASATPGAAPDAEFPEVLAARARGSDKPSA
jgi:sec-independent protein translocase protein TatA